MAESKFDLAQALWAVGQERERARTLAAEARALFDPKLAPTYVELIDQFLAATGSN